MTAANGSPVADIVFPPPRSLTLRDSITVRGTGSDPDGGEIVTVRVNGVAATSSDGFATWMANVPLDPGATMLVVETVDASSNRNSQASSAEIARTVLLPSPVPIELDAANRRVLVLDNFLDTVIAIDLQDGSRTILSDPTTPDGDNALSGPRDATLDSGNERLLVVDVSLDVVIAVSLIDGKRTVLSNDTTISFADPRDADLDPANNRLLVTDVATDSIIAVDLDTGARSILSDGTTPNSTTPFTFPAAIAVDSARGRALVADNTHGVVVV